jgi:protein SCO1/2
VVWVLVIASIPVVRAVRAELPDPPPIYGEIEDFSLTDQHGEPFGSEQLRGRVWVANFIFTRCATVCPLFTKEMYEVQHRSRMLGEAFHLVSFTVDPEFDTPEVLADYARENLASAGMWSFLSGEEEDIRATVVDGMKSAMVPAEGGDPQSLIHGSHFVLIDVHHRIRGFYDYTEEDTVDRVLADVNLLINMRGAQDLEPQG